MNPFKRPDVRHPTDPCPPPEPLGFDPHKVFRAAYEERANAQTRDLIPFDGYWKKYVASVEHLTGEVYGELTEAEFRAWSLNTVDYLNVTALELARIYAKRLADARNVVFTADLMQRLGIPDDDTRKRRRLFVNMLTAEACLYEPKGEAMSELTDVTQGFGGPSGNA